jgi:hypothetical protein
MPYYMTLCPRSAQSKQIKVSVSTAFTLLSSVVQFDLQENINKTGTKKERKRMRQMIKIETNKGVLMT